MAGMSVIGIDFGTDSCYVAVAKAGGIETIANDYSLRATPSCVAFAPANRVLGVQAHNQMVTNMNNTVTAFKRLLGRQWSDPHVQRELRHLPFRVEETKNGRVGVRVRYLDEECVFTPEQLTAMLFTKLKETSAQALQTQIHDCVVSVPSYFGDAERRALLDAARIAGLNVLRLMNETTATALAYGIYKQDLPPSTEKPRHVAFVDMGHAALQVAVCAFHHGALKVLATASDANLGGRDIDRALADHFVQDFQARYKFDARNSPKAYLRLLQESEKLKKQMSANSTKLPLNIECFYEERDVTGEMQRTLMESLCQELFARVERTLRNCLQQSKLRHDDIHSVEIVGGSSRIPAVKAIIEKVFGKSPSTTLNQDEAVARGAALQCAILSPAVRVRDFSVTDVQPYAINLCWEDDMGEEGKMEVFPVNHPAPFSKLLTFFRKNPFKLTAFYADPLPCPEPFIGKWLIKDVKPNAQGESQKIKVKVRVNIHGIVVVSNATIVEKKGGGADDEQDAQQEMNQDGQENGGGGQEPEANNQERHNGTAADDSSTNEDSADKKDKGNKGKNKCVKVELPIEACPVGFSQKELDELLERELKMQATDRREKERADARNALEEYVYELRSAISDDGNLKIFTSQSERGTLQNMLEHTENWLYEEGEGCDRQVYSDKLGELKTLGEPIKVRCMEYEGEPDAREDFNRYVSNVKSIVQLYRNNDPKYNHLVEADVNKVASAIEVAEKWLATVYEKNCETPSHQDRPFTVQQIRQEKQNFVNIVNPIVSKPKPKEKTPPPSGEGQQDQQQQPSQEQQQNSTQSAAGDQMDVE